MNRSPRDQRVLKAFWDASPEVTADELGEGVEVIFAYGGHTFTVNTATPDWLDTSPTSPGLYARIEEKVLNTVGILPEELSATLNRAFEQDQQMLIAEIVSVLERVDPTHLGTLLDGMTGEDTLVEAIQNAAPHTRSIISEEMHYSGSFGITTDDLEVNAKLDEIVSEAGLEPFDSAMRRRALRIVAAKINFSWYSTPAKATYPQTFSKKLHADVERYLREFVDEAKRLDANLAAIRSVTGKPSAEATNDASTALTSALRSRNRSAKHK